MTFFDQEHDTSRRPPDEDRWVDDGGDGRSAQDHPFGWDDDDSRVYYRPARRRIGRILVSLAFLALVGAVMVFGVYRWFERQLDPPGDPGEAVTLVIPPGATTADIGRLFETEGVIPNSMFFRYYAQWRGEGNFQAGEYEVQRNSSAAEAISVLRRGPVPPVYERFTVPEGLWIGEALETISAQTGVPLEELQEALGSGQVPARYRPEGITAFEGLLFPDTYEIEDDASALEILNRMAEEFARVTGELGYGAAEQRLDVSAYEAVIIASLIEAEARTDADRPKIARVIYNRLLQGEPLGIDATYIYAGGQRGRAITRSEIEADSPWNLRTRPGLPPHPIALPGRASLEAAVNPAEGPWLYYVLADEQGNHFFTDDYNEFLRVRDESRAKGLF